MILADPDKASLKDWIAVGAANLGAFMAILDITMNNASLRDIQGTLAAGADESSWIITAYLIGEVIAIPTTGWLCKVFSTKKYLVTNLFLFVVFSVVCGATHSFPIMILARFFQGMTGGVMIPISSSIIMTKLPLAQRPIGFAFFSISISIAPAIGPTVGGWLTTTYGWPSSFYINVLPGALVLLMIFYSFESEKKRTALLRDGDWFGIWTMIVGLGSLIYILEEGNRKDWLGDKVIFKLTCVCLLSLALFVWNELRVKAPLVDLKLFLERNFLLGTAAFTFYGAFVFGNLYIIPSFLTQVQGYNAFDVGKVLAWSGPFQIPIILLVPFLMKRFDGRMIAIFGFAMFLISSYLNVSISQDTGGDQLILPLIFRSIGQGFIVAPLASLAYSNIKLDRAPSAVALLNLMRTLGGSLITGGVGTFLSHRYAMHFSRIGDRITQASYSLSQDNSLSQNLTSSNGEDYLHGVTNLAKIINREANIMAFSDAFLILAGITVLSAFFVFFLKGSATAVSSNADH